MTDNIAQDLFWRDKFRGLYNAFSSDERKSILDGFTVDLMKAAPLKALYELLTRASLLRPEHADQVACTIWTTLESFMNSFPPKRVSPLYVELFVLITCACLDQMSDANSVRIATQLWEREGSSEHRWRGINRVLRIASGVFPQTLNPLLRLLVALSVNPATTNDACWTLQCGLESLTELSEGYANALISVEDDNEALKFIRDIRGNSDYEKVLVTTIPSEGNTVFVQAKRTIPTSSYRPAIPSGSFGCGSEETGAVTWAIQWNGWLAVSEVLSLFLRQVQQPTFSQRNELDVDHFLNAVATSLDFIERICLSGSEEIRQMVSEEMKLMQIVTEIFVELADPGDRPELSWLSKSMQEDYLTKTSSCLAALVIGDIERSQHVLEQLVSTKGRNQPLRSALTILGASSFMAISAIMSIAGSFYAETHLPNGMDISSLLSSVTGMEGRIDSQSSSQVMSTLAESALPIWSTLGPPPVSKEERQLSYAWWDFPADVLMFLRGPTALSVNSVPVSNCIGKIITKAVSPSIEKESDAIRFSILRALLAGLNLAVDCFELIRSKQPENDSKNKELANVQKALLTVDATYGLALICSGCAPLLDDDMISAAQSAASTQLFVRKFEVHHSAIDCSVLEPLKLKNLIEDLAAKCLSSLFKSLQAGIQNEDIVQAPWPLVTESVIDKRRSEGLKIRNGIAKRLEGRGSYACAELLSCILENGQRGAARALLGPFQSSKSGENEASAPAKNSILNSLVKTIREGLNAWVSEANIGVENENQDELHSFANRSRIICKYVHFLTALWDSQNTHWFQDVWDSENIWALLASILKCEGRLSSSTFNLSRFVASSYEDLCSSITLDEPSSSNENNLEQRIMEVCNDVDGPGTWRQTAADILTLFSCELLFCAGKAHKVRSGISPEDTDSKAKVQKICDDLFSNPQFQTFGEVFTERWIHILLQPEEWLLFPKVDGDVDLMRNDQAAWNDHETLESWTMQVSKQLAEVLELEHRPEAPILNIFAKETTNNYGPDYKFDVRMISLLLKRSKCSDSDVESVIVQIMRLNALWGRADVQMKLVHSYAAMAYSVVFADEFAPAPGKALSYASPQFSGKLCRCLARYIVSMHIPTHFSAYGLEFQREMVQLLAFMSARIAQEELEQGALTAVRFTSNLDEDVNIALRKSTLGQLCYTIDKLVPEMRKRSASEKELECVSDIVKCLLVSASYLNNGAAFRDEEDVFSLEQTTVDVLRVIRKDSGDVAQCAATAIMSLHSCTPSQLETLFQDVNIAECVLETIGNLDNLSSAQDYMIPDSVPTLLLMLGQLMLWLPDSSPAKKSAAQVALRNLSGGSISALFPQGATLIRTYNPKTLRREPMHIAWCASLSLAVLSMKHVPDIALSCDEVERHELDVMDFALSNLERICHVSLNLLGDWPTDGTTTHRQHVTIARVEEAEIAAETLFQLSFRAIQLVNRMPDLTPLAIMQLLGYVRLVHKLLRFEPIERWIKPVSDHEKQRSEFTRQGKDIPAWTGSLMTAGSPWVHSPQTPNVHASPPLRSPRQTIIAAISGSGGKTPISARVSPFAPPSPGIPPTPQLQSPLVSSASRANTSASPMSPWTPHGAGLISDRGLLFGEECALSLLRGLNCGLGALRNFGKSFNEPFVEPVMHRSESLLDFGTLIALMYHCVTEIQRGAEEERRNLYMMIIENSLQLAVTHLSIYEERGALDTGFRNELANKMNTVVVRMRKIVPPAPPYSLVHSEAIDHFIRCLHENLL